MEWINMPNYFKIIHEQYIQKTGYMVPFPLRNPVHREFYEMTVL